MIQVVWDEEEGEYCATLKDTDHRLSAFGSTIEEAIINFAYVLALAVESLTDQLDEIEMRLEAENDY